MLSTDKTQMHRLQIMHAVVDLSALSDMLAIDGYRGRRCLSDSLMASTAHVCRLCGYEETLKTVDDCDSELEQIMRSRAPHIQSGIR